MTVLTIVSTPYNFNLPYTANVEDYGAVGDGATVCTAAINTAASAANAAGGGQVFFPPGTYVTGPLTLYPNVHFVGAGIGATTLLLQAGTNADLLSGQVSSINLAAAQNSGPNGTLFNFSVRDMTLDGNKGAQTGGTSYPLRCYGYGFILQNLRVRNGYSGGILTDWNGGSASPGNDSMEAQWLNLKVHDCNGWGIECGGPHDSQWANVLSFNNAGGQIHIAPNCTGVLGANVHTWGTSSGFCGWVIESGANIFTSSVAEAPPTQALAIIGMDNKWLGRIFALGNFGTSSGVQIGQTAGLTPWTGQVLQSAGVTTAVAVSGLVLDVEMVRCEGPNGSIWLLNTGGGNVVRAHVYLTAGAVINGSPNAADNLWVSTTGLASTGTRGTGGENLIESSSTHALQIGPRGSDVFNMDSYNKKLELPNGTYLHIFSDNYSTEKFSANKDGLGSVVSAGSLSVGQSATAAAIANAGTITTASIGVARVAPTGNVTGIIMQAGTVAGQICTVVNESAFTVTFDVAGTSHVADGTSDVIAATTARRFIWDSGSSLWYRCG